MKRRIVLIVSLVAGLAGAFLTRMFISAKEAEYLEEKDRLARKYGTMKVLAYTRDTPAGTVLSAGDIGQKTVPAKGLKGQAVELEHLRDIIGRRTLVGNDAKEVIFWSDIEGGNPSAKGLSADIKRQMRAMSINVTGAASVSGMVRPNDHVDVIGTFDFPSDGELVKRGDPVTCTILQNVLVLATGKETAKFHARELGVPQGYATVTLEVTPREAEMLAFAEQMRGRLVLTLRNANDTSTERELPNVDFAKIRSEIEELNQKRQMKR
ncbi:MAG: Flp pilus assembly protein CpaB [Kiritimatiellae bacterium]|nr:Flp pilus assembly protein CpaB [Kiritimatiellia bacterium]